MPQPNPGGPNFRELAKTVVADLQRRPAEAVLGYDPERIVADALETAFYAGGADTMSRHTLVPGRACLTYASMGDPSTSPRIVTVFASDPAGQVDSTPELATMTFGDRALIRALAAEMLRRLDLTEKREIADRAKRGQS